MTRRLTIIGSFVSPYVRKVLACLNLKGLDYEIDPITPFFGNDEFERLSPLRRIPVLVDGDFSISDSSVICDYLDDAYPGHSLYPRDPKERARAHWFEEYADTRLGDLFIWSPWPMFDPEFGTLQGSDIVTGFETGQFPSTRSMGFTLSVGL